MGHQGQARSRFGEAVVATGAVGGDGIVDGAGACKKVAEPSPAGEGFGGLQAVVGGTGIPRQARKVASSNLGRLGIFVLQNIQNVALGPVSIT